MVQGRVEFADMVELPPAHSLPDMFPDKFAILASVAPTYIPALKNGVMQNYRQLAVNAGFGPVRSERVAQGAGSKCSRCPALGTCAVPWAFLMPDVLGVPSGITSVEVCFNAWCSFD